MKKIILTTVCAFAVTGAAFAQGTLGWSSISAGAMTAQTNGTAISPLFGGGAGNGGAQGATGGAISTGLGYYYELLYNTAYTGSQVATPGFAALFGGTWIDLGLSASNSTTAGRLIPINPNTQASTPASWSPGTYNNVMLVGWSANLGTSWGVVSNELATGSYTGILQGLGQNGFFGESATGYLTPNAPGSGGAIVFNATATANGLPINSLNTQLYLLPVPEPASMALVGLGGLSLMLIRRKRKS